MKREETILSAASIDALRHKADVAEDTYDPNDNESLFWADVATECRKVADARTVVALSESKEAQGELADYISGTTEPSELRPIVKDLCRAGHFEKHDPNAICTKRIKTTTVDGVKYSTGY